MTILCDLAMIYSEIEVTKLLDKSRYLREGRPEKANFCISDIRLLFRFINFILFIFKKQPDCNWPMILKLKSALRNVLPLVKEQLLEDHYECVQKF